MLVRERSRKGKRYTIGNGGEQERGGERGNTFEMFSKLWSVDADLILSSFNTGSVPTPITNSVKCTNTNVAAK